MPTRKIRSAETAATVGYEAKLWQMADALRGGMEMREANARGEALKLSGDELAFDDALEVNDSAVKVLGEPTLVKIARELVDTVKRNVTIDWTLRENVRAQLRVIVKRILRKYGYPPTSRRRQHRRCWSRRRCFQPNGRRHEGSDALVATQEHCLGTCQKLPRL